MEEEFVIKTVEKAKTTRKIRKPLIIHSDRGRVYGEMCIMYEGRLPD